MEYAQNVNIVFPIEVAIAILGYKIVFHVAYLLTCWTNMYYSCKSSYHWSLYHASG